MKKRHVKENTDNVDIELETNDEKMIELQSPKKNNNSGHPNIIDQPGDKIGDFRNSFYSIKDDTPRVSNINSFNNNPKLSLDYKKNNNNNLNQFLKGASKENSFKLLSEMKLDEILKINSDSKNHNKNIQISVTFNQDSKSENQEFFIIPKSKRGSTLKNLKIKKINGNENFLKFQLQKDIDKKEKYFKKYFGNPGVLTNIFENKLSNSNKKITKIDDFNKTENLLPQTKKKDQNQK